MLNVAVNDWAKSKVSKTLWPAVAKKASQVLKIKKDLKISLAIVDDNTIRQLNRLYRHQNRVTDVLSFGEVDQKKGFTGFTEKNYLGEIIISYPQAVRQAKDSQKSVGAELRWLFSHGILHLLGYNHDKIRPAEEMRQLERKISG